MQVTKMVTTPKKVTNSPSEAKIQQEIVLWFSQNYETKNEGFIYHAANGGSRNVIEAKKLKNEGVRAGVADLEIKLMGGLNVMVEVKTETGVQSDAQKLFEKRMKHLGFDYYLVRSLEQFKQCIEISHTKVLFLKSINEHVERCDTNKNNA
jgi:hypothetical protein